MIVYMRYLTNVPLNVQIKLFRKTFLGRKWVLISRESPIL